MNKHTDLTNLINYAYSEVEYYQKAFETYGVEPNTIISATDLSQLPTLLRKDICEQEQQLVAKQYKKYPGINQVEVRRVFGIDGTLFRTYWSQKDSDAAYERISMLRDSRYGIKEDMKSCMFHGATYKGNKLFNYEAQKLRTDKHVLSLGILGLTDSRLQEYYQLICNFEPDWLLLPSGLAVLLVDFLVNNQLPLPSCLKYIEIQGMIISDDLQQKIEEEFHVNVANLFWMPEMGAIAYFCDENRLHVFTRDIIVETLENEHPVVGIEGDIHVTSLSNYAMPLIRYKTGLRGLLSEDDCQCGNGKTLKLAPLSYSEVYKLGTGVSFCRMALESLIEITNENMQNCIYRYSINQNEQYDFHVCFELKPAFKGWGCAVKDEFLNNINWPEFQDINWVFETYSNYA